MTRRLLFFFSVFAFAAPQFISQIAPQQPQGFGTIRGTIVREGTTEPIPDVPVSITGRGGMTAQEAQALLTAVARGGALGANVSAEFLQNAQEAARGDKRSRRFPIARGNSLSPMCPRVSKPYARNWKVTSCRWPMGPISLRQLSRSM